MNCWTAVGERTKTLLLLQTETYQCTSQAQLTQEKSDMSTTSISVTYWVIPLLDGRNVCQLTIGSRALPTRSSLRIFLIRLFLLRSLSFILFTSAINLIKSISQHDRDLIQERHHPLTMCVGHNFLESGVPFTGLLFAAVGNKVTLWFNSVLFYWNFLAQVFFVSLLLSHSRVFGSNAYFVRCRIVRSGLDF